MVALCRMRSLCGAVLALGAWTVMACASTFAPDALRKQATHEVAEALQLMDDGQFEAARASLIDIARKNPMDRTARLALGYIYLKTDPQTAIAIARDILDEGQKDAQALDILGAGFAVLRTRTRSGADEVMLRLQEINALNAVVARYQGWPDPLFRRASHQIAVERLDPGLYPHLEQAVTALEQVVVMLDDDATEPHIRATAWFQLGRGLKHLEDARPTKRDGTALPANYERAIACFRTTLAIDPRRIDAVGEIVLVYRSIDDPASALEVVQNMTDQIAAAPTADRSPFVLAKMTK